MVMDLMPINPAPNAPRESDGKVEWGRYNIAGWSWLVHHLRKWNVDVSEFRGINDGDVICEETCLAVADAIENHLDELDEHYKEWLQSHIVLWRTCGGYEQW